MADSFVNKAQELRKYFPPPFYKLQDGQGLAILLDIIGGQLDDLTTQTQNARNQYLLASALSSYLQVHGLNFDVFKPVGYRMQDNTYRQLIEIVSNSPKNIEYCFERLLALFFGANAIANGLCDVYSYRNMEAIVVLKKEALIIASSRDLYGTTYLHRTGASYDGLGATQWTSTLLSNAPAGSMSITLATTPVGIPTTGIVELSAASEVKLFTRVGSVLTFQSPLIQDYFAGNPAAGPVYPDDYPSAYTYDRQILTDLVGTYPVNATSCTIAFVPDRFPLVGTAYFGSPTASNFEAKGFTRSGTTLTLEGGFGFPHPSGDEVIIPNFPRMIKTTLNQTINAGSSMSEITVSNGADFPLTNSALLINRSFLTQEIIPFTARKLADNTKLLIDPAYVFQFAHSPGEAVNLMARQTAPTIDGLDWPFYLNDTDSLRVQFQNLLRRIKMTGVKLVFQVI